MEPMGINTLFLVISYGNSHFQWISQLATFDDTGGYPLFSSKCGYIIIIHSPESCGRKRAWFPFIKTIIYGFRSPYEAVKNYHLPSTMYHNSQKIPKCEVIKFPIFPIGIWHILWAIGISPAILGSNYDWLVVSTPLKHISQLRDDIPN